MGFVLAILNNIALLISIILSLALALIILVVLLLFIPIKYNVILDKDSKITVDIKAVWIFNAVRFYYIIDLYGNTITKVKLLWKTVYNEKVSAEEKEERKTSAVDADYSESKKSEDNEKENTPLKTTKEIKSKAKKKSGGSNFSFMDIINYPDRNSIISETLLAIKRIVIRLLPDVFSLRLEFGMDDPALTGYLLGVLCVLIEICKLDFKVAGDFNNKKLICNLKVKGSLNLLVLLWEIIRYALKKPIWNLIKKLFLRKDRKK